MGSSAIERRGRRMCAVAGVLLAGALVGGCSFADAIDAAQERQKNEREREADKPTTARVVHVVDGDTVKLANGEHVRLIGIDAPEDGVCGCGLDQEAHPPGRRAPSRLVRGTDNRDKYDRLLRYVDRGGVDAGLAMIQSGLAIARYDSRDGYGEHPRQRAYLKADRKAANVECTAPPAPPNRSPAPPTTSSTRPRTVLRLPALRSRYPPDLHCADTDRSPCPALICTGWTRQPRRCLRGRLDRNGPAAADVALTCSLDDRWRWAAGLLIIVACGNEVRPRSRRRSPVSRDRSISVRSVRSKVRMTRVRTSRRQV